MIARARERRAAGPRDDLLPRRDPPLQQGPAGRAAARGRGRPGDADRRDDREPVLRGQQRADLPHPGLRAARAHGRAARGADAARARRRRVRRGRGRRRGAQVPRRALGRRRPHGAERARARLRDRRADGRPVVLEDAEDAMQRKAVLYDKGGDQHYDYISAWIKSTRGSDPDASLYYLAAMLEGGEDPRFIVRRMVILASEDMGNADPQALQVAVAAAAAVERVGLPEGAVRARAGGDLPLAGAEVQRRDAGDRLARATSATTARSCRPRRCARRPTRRRPSSAAAGLRLPARPPGPGSTTRTTCRAAGGPAPLRPARHGAAAARAPGAGPPRPRSVTSSRAASLRASSGVAVMVGAIARSDTSPLRRTFSIPRGRPCACAWPVPPTTRCARAARAPRAAGRRPRRAPAARVRPRAAARALRARAARRRRGARRRGAIDFGEDSRTCSWSTSASRAAWATCSAGC